MIAGLLPALARDLNLGVSAAGHLLLTRQVDGSS
jgi:predicted MFS family arabinose efflux permease